MENTQSGCPCTRTVSFAAASKLSDSAFTNLKQRFDYPYDILLRIAKGHQQILGS